MLPPGAAFRLVLQPCSVVSGDGAAGTLLSTKRKAGRPPHASAASTNRSSPAGSGASAAPYSSRYMRSSSKK